VIQRGYMGRAGAKLGGATKWIKTRIGFFDRPVREQDTRKAFFYAAPLLRQHGENAQYGARPTSESVELSWRWGEREWNWLQIRAETCTGRKSADRA
jgi:hypothetical protein